MKEFGTVECPNLNTISGALIDPLARYEDLFPGNVSLALQEPLLPIAGKNYSARGEVRVRLDGNEAGTMYVVAFRPGDGTGVATEAYQFLEIPLNLCNGQNKDGLVPRSKKGTLLEAFFPLATIRDERAIQYVACLEELTVDDVAVPTKIKKAWTLGDDKTAYRSYLRGRPVDHGPRIQLTTGHMRDGSRFGDPHAVHYNHNLCDAVIQVVGFLAVTKENVGLAPILDRLAVVPNQ